MRCLPKEASEESEFRLRLRPLLPAKELPLGADDLNSKWNYRTREHPGSSTVPTRILRRGVRRGPAAAPLGDAGTDGSLRSNPQKETISSGPLPTGAGTCSPVVFHHGRLEQRENQFPLLVIGKEVGAQLFLEPDALAQTIDIVLGLSIGGSTGKIQPDTIAVRTLGVPKGRDPIGVDAASPQAYAGDRAAQ